MLMLPFFTQRGKPEDSSNEARGHDEEGKDATDSGSIGSKRARRPTIDRPTTVSPSAIYNL
jgi:hypothetical protein